MEMIGVSLFQRYQTDETVNQVEVEVEAQFIWPNIHKTHIHTHINIKY